jgi:hypothetical protein
MFKVTVKNLEGIATHGQDWPTLEQVQSWIDQVKPTGAWGKPAYTEIIPAVLDEEGNEVTPEQTIEHQDEFTIEIEDISQQVAFEKEVQKNLARMQFGARLMAELATGNQAALTAGALTVQQIIEAEAALATVQRLILNGSLGLAVGALQEAKIPHLPDSTKLAFIKKMQDYLAAE